ncbi:hypothetical protein BC938DRAFT_478660 [Jimgerdemannia flammicorona]|nr:hypothetical protein BC938DRAFT_478660 [Jimgerdemannia flammicorona]
MSSPSNHPRYPIHMSDSRPANYDLLETVFATIGLVFWSFQLAPQAWKNYRTHSTVGLSPAMLIIFALSSFLYGAYGIARNLSIPLMIQPQLFGFIALVCYVQTLYYGRGFSMAKSWAVLAALCVIMGVGQTALAYAYRAGIENNLEWVPTLGGTISMVLILAGFAPQYWEILCIYITVFILDLLQLPIARSMVSPTPSSLLTSWAQSSRSLASATFSAQSFDALAAANYVGVAVCDIGMIVLYYFFVWYNGNQGGPRRRSRGADVEVAADDVNGEKLPTPSENVSPAVSAVDLAHSEKTADIGDEKLTA